MEESKLKKRYSIRNLLNVLSCVAVESWTNRLHNVVVVITKPYTCHKRIQAAAVGGCEKEKKNECVFCARKTYLVIVNIPLSCFTSIKQLKKKIVSPDFPSCIVEEIEPKCKLGLSLDNFDEIQSARKL